MSEIETIGIDFGGTKMPVGSLTEAARGAAAMARLELEKAEG